MILLVGKNTLKGILPRLDAKRILLKPGVVFHQPQNWSLCQEQHRGLIVSAGYSLNKVRPKLTPGKPTLAGNIATIRPSLLKTGQGRQGRACYNYEQGLTKPCFGHACPA